MRRLIMCLALVMGTWGLAPACSDSGTEEAEELFEDMDPDDPELYGPQGKADNLNSQWPAYSPMPGACQEYSSFLTLFAPDDPTVTLELQQIDRVVDERAQDGNEYAEGENPYRIRYAVYNLSSQIIQDRLFQAEGAGVDVQVLIEADQLHKEWNHVADNFSAAGLEVVYDHEDLDETAKKTVDLVGIDKYGLMHLKTRLFTTPTETVLLTGSLNPNNSSPANEESLHLVRDPVVIADYEQAYLSQLNQTPLPNSWTDGVPINTMFTPAGNDDRASGRLFDWLESEDEQILLMVFTLRNLWTPTYSEPLVDLLAKKKQQGVDVVVITDRKQADGVDSQGNSTYWDDQTDDKLREAGIPVYEAINEAEGLFGAPNPYCAMHHKTVVLGKTNIRVITDASNWTKSALGDSYKVAKNVESMLFIDSAMLDANRTGKRYLGQWLKVLMRYGWQSQQQDGEAAPEEIREQLLNSEDWPTVAVTFAGVVETQFGDEVYIIGDDPALGSWGVEHVGIPLTTDAELYPRWVSPPVELPLGSTVEWKLIIRTRDGYVLWEDGPNRPLEVFLPICGDLQASGTWRE